MITRKHFSLPGSNVGAMSHNESEDDDSLAELFKSPEKNSIEIVRRLDQAISIEPVINEGELDGFTCTMSFARPAKVEHQELRHVLSYESHNEVTRHLLKYWAGRASLAKEQGFLERE